MNAAAHGGDAAPDVARAGRWPQVPRPTARAGIALALGGLAATSLVFANPTSAAVPTFPDNVVVFPDRDFVTIEGYQDHIGETATVTVTRGTQVVGRPSGTVVEGDVAFEINHPGGYCWGAGTGLNVTPDIQAGDKVTDLVRRRRDAATPPCRTPPSTEHAALDADGMTVTVNGHIGAGVNAGAARAADRQPRPHRRWSASATCAPSPAA